MLIDINTLSEDKLNEIPLSIRLHSIKYSNSIIDTDTLPYEVAQHLISNTPSTHDFSFVGASKTVVDLTPKLNVYNDFLTIDTKKDAIIEYIKNYFRVNRGEYPFDPTFGTKLKQYLNTLDVPTQRLLISNEVKELVSALSISFVTPISLVSLSITNPTYGVMTEVNINMVINITEGLTSNNFTVDIVSFVS